MFLLQPRRLSFGGFGTLRKKRPEDAAEYVCPMNVEMPRSSSFQTGVRMYEEHLEHLEQVPRRRLAEKNIKNAQSFVSVSSVRLFYVFWQMEDSEGTVRQIGEFSEEINNLTVRPAMIKRGAGLQRDRWMI